MPKILPAFAVLVVAAFLALPSPANAVPQLQGAAETDRSAKASTDISSHRRRYRHRHHHRGYYGVGPYWAPRPYYGYVRPNPYREWYWGPRLFPYGPWW